MNERKDSHVTHVTFVLDSSGSMRAIEEDTREGFNGFLRDQKEEEGDATVTLYEFDTEVELVYRDIPVEEAPELDRDNYKPGGSTALHDAIERAVDETDESLQRPESVIVVVLTDGRENASSTSAEEVRRCVEEKREEGWEFLFVGANQDAALTAERMGMDSDKSLDMEHTGEGTKAAYEATSKSVSRARRRGRTGGYTEGDRRRQNRDGDESGRRRRRSSGKDGDEDNEECSCGSSENGKMAAKVGGHEEVIGIAGAPPMHCCQVCRISRSTHAGLRDVPCQPDRYDGFDPSERLSEGDLQTARVDQRFDTDEKEGVEYLVQVLAHTHGTGVRILLEMELDEDESIDVKRGDVIEVRITDIDRGEVRADFERVLSTEERVKTPVLRYVGKDGGRDGSRNGDRSRGRDAGRNRDRNGNKSSDSNTEHRG